MSGVVMVRCDALEHPEVLYPAGDVCPICVSRHRAKIRRLTEAPSWVRAVRREEGGRAATLRRASQRGRDARRGA